MEVKGNNPTEGMDSSAAYEYFIREAEVVLRELTHDIHDEVVNEKSFRAGLKPGEHNEKLDKLVELTFNSLLKYKDLSAEFINGVFNQCFEKIGLRWKDWIGEMSPSGVTERIEKYKSLGGELLAIEVIRHILPERAKIPGSLQGYSATSQGVKDVLGE